MVTLERAMRKTTPAFEARLAAAEKVGFLCPAHPEMCYAAVAREAGKFYAVWFGEFVPLPAGTHYKTWGGTEVKT